MLVGIKTSKISKTPISSKVKSSVNRRVLSVDEMKEAEKEIIKHTQRVSFPEFMAGNCYSKQKKEN